MAKIDAWRPGERRFGAVNWLGLKTLCRREIMRFMKVWSQTVLAPLATSTLFMTVFHFALATRRGDVAGMPVEAFLAPGVLMMAVIQNAFANTSSSLVIAKIQGNIVDTLMPPLSPHELLVGFAVGGIVRGVVVALGAGLPIFLALGLGLAHPLWALVFCLLGAAALALAGILAGVICEKYDQMAAVANFVVTPLAFLSGTFYSIADLPGWFQTASRLNPVFYLINGFRHGAAGAADADPWTALAVALATVAALWTICARVFAKGAGLKS